MNTCYHLRTETLRKQWQKCKTCFVLAIHRQINKVIFVIENVIVQTTKIALYAPINRSNGMNSYEQRVLNDL
jgi:hypothetical protein